MGRRDESGSAAETRGKNGVSDGIRIWELGKPHEEQVVEVAGLGCPLQRLAHDTSSEYVQSGTYFNRKLIQDHESVIFLTYFYY